MFVQFDDAELPKHLSYSAVSNYMKCPMLFYWGQIKKVSVPEKLISVIPFGSTIHGVLEENYSKKALGESSLVLEEAQDLFKKEWAKRRDIGFESFKDFDYQRLYDVGLDLLRVYFATHEPMVQPRAVEQEIVVDINRYPGLRIKGIIDLVDDDVIVDHKVSTGWINQFRADIDHQLTTYAILYRKFFKQRERAVAYDYLFISKSSVKVDRIYSTREEYQIDETLALFNHVLQSIKDRRFYKISNQFECSSCKYRHLCHGK